MIAFAKPQKNKKPKKWYLLITKEPAGAYDWGAIFEEQYDVYQRHFIIEKDFEIVAGPYAVNENVLDRVTGINSKGEEIGPKYLEELVRNMNLGEEINAAYELEKLIRGS